MMKQNIVFLVSSLRSSGPINQLHNIIHGLEDRYEISILELSDKSTVEDRERFRNLGTNINCLELSTAKSLIIGYRVVDNQIPKDAIIHSHGFRSDLIAARLSRKSVSTLHNYPYNDYPYRYGKLQGGIMSRLHLRSLKNIDEIIGCSQTVTSLLKKHSLKSKTIRNSVKLREYTPTSRDEKRSARNNLDLPIQNKIFICVGNLINIKDPITVIDGFKKFIQNSTSGNVPHLIFLGDGELRAACEDCTENQDNIHIKGYVTNVAEYLTAADYYISASLYEGLPTAVLEAAASGLPVCLSDIEPHKEILDLSDYKAGVTFKKNSAMSLSQNLLKLMSNDYYIMSSAARKIVSDDLNSKEMGEQYSKIYDSL